MSAAARSYDFLPGVHHAIVPAGEHGTAKIVHDTPSAGERLRGMLHGQPLDCQKYTRLLINGRAWMTDAEFEWRSNLELMQRARGNVLLAGLGIGYVVYPLLQHPRVKTVTVIENSADVIALVVPHLPTAKLTVLRADAYRWKPRAKYDVIYFDIWRNIPNEDDAPDIARLKVRYRPALKSRGWMKAWCEDYHR